MGAYSPQMGRVVCNNSTFARDFSFFSEPRHRRRRSRASVSSPLPFAPPSLWNRGPSHRRLGPLGGRRTHGAQPYGCVCIGDYIHIPIYICVYIYLYVCFVFMCVFCRCSPLSLSSHSLPACVLRISQAGAKNLSDAISPPSPFSATLLVVSQLFSLLCYALMFNPVPCQAVLFWLRSRASKQ